MCDLVLAPRAFQHPRHTGGDTDQDGLGLDPIALHERLQRFTVDPFGDEVGP